MAFAPTLADIREQVMLKLRLDPADQTIATYWIQQAYADIAQYVGFDWDTTTVYGLQEASGGFDLPCEVAWVRHIKMIYPGGGSSYPAQQVRSEQVLARQQSNSAGPSESGIVYAVLGQFSVIFWPFAVQGQQVEIRHTVVPDALEDDDTPLLQEPYGSKLLEYGALVEGAKFKKDPLMSDFEQSYAMWTERYVTWINRRKGASSTAFEVWPGERTVDRLDAESEAWGHS
jgi:hypothetical protein